jgi:hypothetical protein
VRRSSSSNSNARLNMDDLADKILRTMRRAQAALADRVADIADRTVGHDSETARAVVASFERRFPVGSESDKRDDRPGGSLYGG